MLIIGLGNPGAQYQLSRHNVGFICADVLAEHWGLGEFGKGFESLFVTGKIQQKTVIIAKPQTFMNLSGKAVQALVSFYKIPLEQMYVIHDEVELPLGVTQCRLGGSARGHNGLRSIDALLGQQYYRIRCGVGRPKTQQPLADFVLSSFETNELMDVKRMTESVIKVLETSLA